MGKLSSRLDFRRLPGPVLGWVRAHFPEQRLVIEPNCPHDNGTQFMEGT